MSWDKADWERLGDYVTSARVRLNMDRYGLATGADISVRTLADIENGELGKRRAFSSETLEAIGLCIGWKPGSWRAILNGGEPEQLESGSALTDVEEDPRYDEPIEMVPQIVDALDQLSSPERQALAKLVDVFAHREMLTDDRQPYDFVFSEMDGRPVAVMEIKGGALQPHVLGDALTAWATKTRQELGLAASQLQIYFVPQGEDEKIAGYKIDLTWSDDDEGEGGARIPIDDPQPPPRPIGHWSYDEALDALPHEADDPQPITGRSRDEAARLDDKGEDDG